MRRGPVRYVLIGFASLVGIFILAVAAFMLGGPNFRRKVYFTLTGTSDPIALLAENTPPAQRIAYGADPLQFGELSLPSNGTRAASFPVAIIVHGGCWEAKLPGLPAAATSLDLLRPLSAALAQQGIAAWNVEYRRLGNAGGGWPGTYQDVAAAADSLTAIAAEKHLDLKHVIVIGHSAGGPLALWLAARPKLTATSSLYTASPLHVTGVVDIDGPPSMRAATALDDQVCGTHVVTEFMGGSPTAVGSRYAEGSADGLLPLGVRQQLLYSLKTEFLSDHRERWVQLFTSYATAATRAGDSVELTPMEKAGHFDGINPHSKTWPTVLSKIKALL